VRLMLPDTPTTPSDPKISIAVPGLRRKRPFALPRLLAREPRPGWLWIVGPATLAYLIVEFSFNARLLDAVGGTATPCAVDSIETWGRALSGCAVALALWPTLLSLLWRAALRPSVRLICFLAASAIVVALVSHLEQRLVDRLVDRSSGADRAAAANGILIQRALLGGALSLPGFPVAGAQLEAPDAKAFVAVVPLLSSMPSAADAAIRTQRPRIVQQLVDAALGGPAAAYSRHNTALEAFSSTYQNAYWPASLRYQAALARIPARQNEAWHAYRKEIGDRARGHTPLPVARELSPSVMPRDMWSGVRIRLRNEGLILPERWRPDDRSGFDAAVSTRVKAEADRQFLSASATAVPGGSSIRPGLTRSALLAVPAVQTALRTKLGYPDGLFVADPPAGAAGYAWFVRENYQPLINARVADELERYGEPAASYANGGRYEDFGRTAMTALVAPPLALLFSLLGALVHVMKSLLYGIQMFTGYATRSSTVKVALALAGALAIFTGSGTVGASPITTTPLYLEYAQQAERVNTDTGDHAPTSPTRTGLLAAYALGTMIRAEPVLYPAFEAVRLKVLRGFAFGDWTSLRPAGTR
jgi:hypothetical protein